MISISRIVSSFSFLPRNISLYGKMKDMENSPEKNKKKLPFILTGIISLLVGFTGGYFLCFGTHLLSNDEKKLIEEYRLLKDDWLYGNEDTLFGEQALSGLLSGAATAENDPYTFYTSTKSEQGLDTTGKGFGISYRYYGGNLYLVGVENSKNSDKLRMGDVLTSVRRGKEDPYVFVDHSYTDVKNYLNEDGHDSDSFVFTLLRKNTSGTEEEKEVSLVKTDYSENVITLIQSPSAENSRTMMVKINTFLGTPAENLSALLKGYQDISTLVLDLRGNGGGYVQEAEKMAELFVKKGSFIYEMVDKNNKIVAKGTQISEPAFSIPHFRVIVDSNTASASELFTLAMRAGVEDGKVYGLKSYGKGIAQDFHTFSDGSVVRYTSAYVYGPERENETMYDEGKDSDKIMCIHKKGILPDVAYGTDYVFLEKSYDFTKSIGLSEASQNFFLQGLALLYPDSYPSSYSGEYHFVDAVKDYGKSLALRYSDASYLSPFSTDGTVKKTVSDAFNKETFDGYLKYYDLLTNEVLQ